MSQERDDGYKISNPRLSGFKRETTSMLDAVLISLLCCKDMFVLCPPLDISKRLLKNGPFLSR